MARNYQQDMSGYDPSLEDRWSPAVGGDLAYAMGITNISPEAIGSLPPKIAMWALSQRLQKEQADREAALKGYELQMNAYANPQAQRAMQLAIAQGQGDVQREGYASQERMGAGKNRAEVQNAMQKFAQAQMEQGLKYKIAQEGNTNKLQAEALRGQNEMNTAITREYKPDDMSGKPKPPGIKAMDAVEQMMRTGHPQWRAALDKNGGNIAKTMEDMAKQLSEAYGLKYSENQATAVKKQELAVRDAIRKELGHSSAAINVQPPFSLPADVPSSSQPSYPGDYKERERRLRKAGQRYFGQGDIEAEAGYPGW